MASVTKPMLCATVAPDELSRFSPETYAAEVKLDGWRALASKDEGRIRLIMGRNGSNYSGHVPHIEQALLDVLPDGTMVDGEIVSMDGWGSVQSAMTTNEVHDRNDLTLVIFDLLSVSGTEIRSWSWQDRRALVEKVQFDGRRELGISRLVRPTEAEFEAVVGAGFEGLVVKLRSSGYAPGRSKSWVKVKCKVTCECPIVGLPHDGKNSIKGLVGAIEFQMPNGQIGRASGMKMWMRKDMTHNPKRYLGRMAEFAYQEMTEDGRMRSPRFKRMRPDLETTIQPEEKDE